MTSMYPIDTTHPRIQDLKLAEALGFAKLFNVRKLIERHINSLKSFGEIIFSTVEKTSKGGRPGKEYWLNEKQVLYLCTKSEAQNAIDITIQMVEVFYAVKSGQSAALPPVPKLTSAQMVEIQKQMLLRFPDGPGRAQAYIALKEHFGVARYYEIEESRFDEAIAFIQSAPLCCSPEKALDRLIDYIDTRLMDGYIMSAVHEESAHLLEIAKILRGDIRGKLPPEHRREWQTKREAAA